MKKSRKQIQSLAVLLYNSFSIFKNHVAIKINNNTISYAKLNEKAMIIAGFLSKCGGINKNIGIITQRNYSCYAGVLGSIYAGSAYVPINAKYPKSRILNIINEADVQIIIGNKNDWNMIKSKIKDTNRIRHILLPDSDEVIDCDKETFNKTDLNEVDPISKLAEVNYNNNVYIMFTSGSTGKAKGVQVDNLNVTSLLDNMGKYYDLKPGFRASQTFDLSFDLSISDMFFTWLNGGTLCVLQEDELYCPSDYINREKIEFWHSVPTLVDFMYKLNYLKPNMYPSIKYSIFCGEPLTNRIAEAWKNAAPNSTVENLYGPTETTVFVSRYVYKGKDDNKILKDDIVPIGKVFDKLDFAIIDKHNKRVSSKEKGELVISGNQVSKGYIKKRLNSKYFVKMPWDNSNQLWYKTGDLVIINSNNDLEYLGRKDNQIKIAGKRIEIEEIEGVLRSLIEHGEIIVVPYRNVDRIVDFLVAFCSIELNRKEIKIIIESSKDLLDNIFIPKKFIYIDTVPKTASGKMDRSLLEKKAKEYLNV